MNSYNGTQKNMEALKVWHLNQLEFGVLTLLFTMRVCTLKFNLYKTSTFQVNFKRTCTFTFVFDRDI